MTRVQTAASSLVAAVPAGILAALLVMVFLNHAENLKLMTQILVGGTLLAVSAVVLMPFGVLIFGGRKAKAAPSSNAKAAAAGSRSDGEIATSDEILTSDVEEDEDTETVAYSGDDLADSDDLLVEEEEETDFLSDDELLVEEDEEDEPPRKKGRK